MRTLTLTAAQWEAIRQALDSFVENEENSPRYENEGTESAHLAPASEVLDAMNAEIAALADK